MSAAGVHEPHSGPLTTADADLRSLSYGHLVGDSAGPARRGTGASRGSARSPRRQGGRRVSEPALRGSLVRACEMLVPRAKQDRRAFCLAEELVAAPKVLDSCGAIHSAFDVASVSPSAVEMTHAECCLRLSVPIRHAVITSCSLTRTALSIRR